MIGLRCPVYAFLLICAALAVSGCGRAPSTDIDLNDIENSLRASGLSVCDTGKRDFDTPGETSGYQISVATGPCPPRGQTAEQDGAAHIKVSKFDSLEARDEVVRQANILPLKPFWARFAWGVGPYMISISNVYKSDVKERFGRAMRRLEEQETGAR